MEARNDQPPTNLPKPQQQDENLSQEFKNLMSTLPMDEGLLSTIPVYQYQGFWFESRILQAILTCQKHFEANGTDIILVTQPKSGTTWLKALTFALLNRNKYPPTQENNPLLVTNPHILVPFLQSLFYDEKFNIPNISQFPSPRLLSMHFPYVSLPKSIKESDCKIRKESKWTILGSCVGVLERKLGKARENNVSKDHLDPTKTPPRTVTVTVEDSADSNQHSAATKGNAATPKPKATTTTIVQESEAYRKWRQHDLALQTWIAASISKPYQNKILHCKSFHEAWTTIHDLISATSKNRIQSLKSQLRGVKKT
ncbi:hypothetical protein PIB30_018799 [Stylosanthes scabra]|uniref:Sulfotransferase n=1 Tax=Stylosanthes scabra TaxID=79078 RepID=A0ABU6R8A3_9FABA|nr:hypothetical protein [Stylosanthes scabra]